MQILRSFYRFMYGLLWHGITSSLVNNIAYLLARNYIRSQIRQKPILTVYTSSAEFHSDWIRLKLNEAGVHIYMAPQRLSMKLLISDSTNSCSAGVNMYTYYSLIWAVGTLSTVNNNNIIIAVGGRRRSEVKTERRGVVIPKTDKRWV